jgi:hypothetical protein
MTQGYSRKWELILNEQEETDFVVPLEPEDLGQCYSPDVLEYLG